VTQSRQFNVAWVQAALHIFDEGIYRAPTADSRRTGTAAMQHFAAKESESKTPLEYIQSS
jgi:hypothetical protein